MSKARIHPFLTTKLLPALTATILAMPLLSCVSTPPSVPLSELVTVDQQKLMLDADVILIGEQHDNPHHHAIQRQILELVGGKGRLGSVLFEQLHWDQQALVTDLNESMVGGLKESLAWDKSGWPDFHMYQGLFAVAVQHRAQIIAGNVSPQKSKAVYQDGYAAIFSTRDQQTLGLDESFHDSANAALEKEIFDGHCQMIPSEHVRKMIPIQRVRDAAMAWAFVQKRRPGTAVFIVGSGHARKDYGIPWYLKRLDPRLTIYSIALNETGANTDASVYDQVITTSPVAREDPCAELRKKFAKPQRH